MRLKVNEGRYTRYMHGYLIGASLSEPHTSESNSAIVSIYIIMVRTSTESKYKILILRITHYVCEAHYA